MNGSTSHVTPLRVRGLHVFLACLLLSLSAGPRSASAASSGGGPTRTIRVFAASSFSVVADDLVSAYSKKTGVAVELQLGGSAGLATRLENGDVADVFISADEANMYRLVNNGRARAPKPIATSGLAILVSKTSRVPIRNVNDLAKKNALVAVGGRGVPIGDYTQQCFAKAGIKVKPASEEQNVRAIISKVEFGEVDAGVIYRTDTFDPTKATRVAIPAKINVVTTLFGAATVRETGPSTEGIAFMVFLRSSAAQKILKKRGFGIPT